MLWYNNANRSTLDDLLQNNKESIIIEDLLDEEELINELKNMNPRLLDYFSNNKKVVKKLIEYIIIEPPDDINK
jgi:hypothetical protein